MAILSLIPAPAVGGSDKLLHFLTYAALSGVFATLTRSASKVLLAAILLILYGIAIEFAQGLTGYRMFEPADMRANSGGVVAGVLLRVTPLPDWFRRWEQRWT